MLGLDPTFLFSCILFCLLLHIFFLLLLQLFIFIEKRGGGGEPCSISFIIVLYVEKVRTRQSILPSHLGQWLHDDGSDELALQIFFDAVASLGNDPNQPNDLYDVAVELLRLERVILPSSCVVVKMPWSGEMQVAAPHALWLCCHTQHYIFIFAFELYELLAPTNYFSVHKYFSCVLR